MAGDTLSTRGSTKLFGCRKVARTERFLFGFTGSLAVIQPMYEWVAMLDQEEAKDIHIRDFYKLAQRIELGGDYDGYALLADREGTVFELVSNCHVVPSRAGFHAIGSGASYALGALHMGATAEKAVMAAISYDSDTGGMVRTISFDDPVTHPLDA